MKPFAIAIRTTLVTFIVTGLLYPLAITGVAQMLFARAANGSLVADETGRIVGSELIGQAEGSPGYFQPRPSASAYDAAASGGSNLGPTSADLRKRVAEAIDRLRKENPDAKGPVPVELVTCSASGLDPHLSPEAAFWQIPRVAEARGISPSRIRDAALGLVEDRDFGVFGEPRVNVLKLNLALDRQFGRPPR